VTQTATRRSDRSPSRFGAYQFAFVASFKISCRAPDRPSSFLTKHSLSTDPCPSPATCRRPSAASDTMSARGSQAVAELRHLRGLAKKCIDTMQLCNDLIDPISFLTQRKESFPGLRIRSILSLQLAQFQGRRPVSVTQVPPSKMERSSSSRCGRLHAFKFRPYLDAIVKTISYFPRQSSGRSRIIKQLAFQLSQWSKPRQITSLPLTSPWVCHETVCSFGLAGLRTGI
jgi:hypothetical protein